LRMMKKTRQIWWKCRPFKNAISSLLYRFLFKILKKVLY
jgi:hypothetical protein